MANPRIVDYYPPASGVALPLSSKPSITFDQVLDIETLQDNFFLEGPDTDQFIGPGLLEISYPDNVPQGALDDFLRSPGYSGIVPGTFVFETVEVNTITGVVPGTKLTFTPDKTLSPKTDYVSNLTGVFDIETSPGQWNTFSGVNWSFQTGTGSIQELPSNLSTSVLADLIQHGWVAAPKSDTPLRLVTSSPKDHSVECNVHIDEIVLEFDKLLDPSSITENSVYVETLPVTDHPSAPVYVQGEVMTQLEVSGYQLKIKI